MAIYIDTAYGAVPMVFILLAVNTSALITKHGTEAAHERLDSEVIGTIHLLLISLGEFFARSN